TPRATPYPHERARNLYRSVFPVEHPTRNRRKTRPLLRRWRYRSLDLQPRWFDVVFHRSRSSGLYFFALPGLSTGHSLSRVALNPSHRQSFPLLEPSGKANSPMFESKKCKAPSRRIPIAWADLVLRKITIKIL